VVLPDFVVESAGFRHPGWLLGTAVSTDATGLRI
jgi:hypothetical protein